MWNGALREGFNCFFRDFLASINEILILAGGMGTRVLFYGVQALS